MRQFTVRGLSEDTERKIEKEARERGVSLNRAIQSLLEKETGKGARHELDHLFGVWSRGEAGEFERHIMARRQGDDRPWTTNV